MSLKKTAYGFFNIVGMNRQKRFLSSLRCGQKDSIAKNARKNGDKVAIFPLIPKATLSFRPKERNLLILCCHSFHSNTQKRFLSSLRFDRNDGLPKSELGERQRLCRCLSPLYPKLLCLSDRKGGICSFDVLL